MIRIWLPGLLARRRGRLLAVSAGVAVAVALLASLGSFLASAKATMTSQAVHKVAVDWQVAVAPGADPARVLATVAAEPGTAVAQRVGFASVPGLTATTASASQTTGAAKVLGLPLSYTSTFPAELRLLSGRLDLASPSRVPQALLAQQTASNLAAKVGDTVAIQLPGGSPLPVLVAGVVDLPQADSLFQRIGAPAGAQASAPPDNVVILTSSAWHHTFDRLVRAGIATEQIHVARDLRLPSDPVSAYSTVLGQAHHLEARLSGAGIVGDSLAAALDSARSDALYAEVLFVFLGLPGAAIAAALTAAVAAAGSDRRRREQSLLRLRGASGSQVIALAAIEALVVGVTGSLVGVGAALLIGLVSFGSTGFGAGAATAATWMAVAAVAGLTVAGGAVLWPVRRELREATVVAGRAATATAARRRPPAVLRAGLDLWFLAGAAIVYHVTSRAGYNLVLAPEGVATISVSYWAFAGPALFWAGVALATWRAVDVGLRRGRRPLAAAARPFSGPLAGLAAASAGRRRPLLARASVLAGLALIFAASTAVFDTTYRAQAGVDARLTNGADVAVSYPPGTSVPPGRAGAIAAVPGVRHVEPMLHRYAYIGADLQDLYGVRPSSIASATSLQNAYFSGGSAAQLISRLAHAPDSILVSSETVRDYQLHPGDHLTLRLLDTRSQKVVSVTFRYAGIVNEFPTAPRDSFFVTNGDYVAAQTGNATPGTFLVGTQGSPVAVAAAITGRIGAGPKVTDITTTKGAVASSLTAVDLAGLTRVELGFAVVLAVAAGGLVLGLGLAERRRELAVAAAVGATRRQVRALVQVDAAVVAVAALISGVVGGAILARILVKVLSGVFDPAPAGLAVPWAYLGTVGALTMIGIGLAAASASRRATRNITSTLRDL